MGAIAKFAGEFAPIALALLAFASIFASFSYGRIDKKIRKGGTDVERLKVEKDHLVKFMEYASNREITFHKRGEKSKSCAAN